MEAHLHVLEALSNAKVDVLFDEGFCEVTRWDTLRRGVAPIEVLLGLWTVAMLLRLVIAPSARARPCARGW
jgi:hypothetical protein